MKKWTVKLEYLPERCEICHQEDFFDANLNQCLRCGDLEKINQKENSIGYREDLEKQFTNNEEDKKKPYLQIPKSKTKKFFKITIVLLVVIFLIVFIIGLLHSYRFFDTRFDHCGGCP